MKLFSGETDLWKTRSAWDPWQMGMGGEKRVGRGRGEVWLVISPDCRRNTLCPRGPSLIPNKSKHDTRPQCQTQNILFNSLKLHEERWARPVSEYHSDVVANSCPCKSNECKC